MNAIDEDFEIAAMEQRLEDFFDTEDVYVMGVADAKHYTFNRKAVGMITSRRTSNNKSFNCDRHIESKHNKITL